MRKELENRAFGVIAAASVCLAALILFVAAPAAAQSMDPPERGTEISAHPGWYDPADWFDRGGPLQRESDWFDYSFDFGQRGMYGYYEPQEAGAAFRLREEQLGPGFGPPGNVLEKNYYTEDWHDRGGAFERWLDRPAS